jgi:hypothetical protein
MRPFLGLLEAAWETCPAEFNARRCQGWPQSMGCQPILSLSWGRLYGVWTHADRLMCGNGLNGMSD